MRWKSVKMYKGRTFRSIIQNHLRNNALTLSLYRQNIDERKSLRWNNNNVPTNVATREREKNDCQESRMRATEVLLWSILAWWRSGKTPTKKSAKWKRILTRICAYNTQTLVAKSNLLRTFSSLFATYTDIMDSIQFTLFHTIYVPFDSQM